MPHKKPSSCNYRTVQRALREDPDAIVSYRAYGVGRWGRVGHLPVTRTDAAEKARMVRHRRKQQEDQQLAHEEARERRRVAGVVRARKVRDPAMAAEIARKRRQERAEAQRRAELTAHGGMIKPLAIYNNLPW